MEPDRVLGVLAEHWNDVRRTVGEERSRTLAGLLGGDGDPLRRRAELIDLLREWLHRDHPVRQAIRRYSDADRSTALDLDWDAALAALHAEEPPEAAEAKRALLAEEHHSPRRVRALGFDPDQPGVLRLPGPDGEAVLPAFQFRAPPVPHPDVIAVNLLHADTDPWGAADWWLRENAWLGGRPCDLIGDERLIAAARAVEGGE